MSTVIYSSLHGFTTKQHNDQSPSWLVSSVARVLHRYRRSHGFKSHTSLNFFFRPYFQQASQVVFIATKITFIFNINSIDETKLSCCIAPPN